LSRRAKIVATVGPASRDPRVLSDLLDAGMDAARLNLSHGEHADHARLVKELRRLSFSREHPLAVIADLPGPKIRTGRLEGGRPVELRPGRRLILTGREVIGNPGLVSVTYPRLAKDVRPGDRILLSDGLIEIRVVEARRGDVLCRVMNGGTLGERKGVNLPGVKLSISSLTPRDRIHLKFALGLGVDLIAQSFVRSARDVKSLKALVRRAGHDTPVLAKIEKPEALEDLDGILEVADGVMVARGDLGVEMSPEKVPLAQKRIIAGANEARIPVITATQMLESMIEHPRPTRAEASDVANAVLDGTDALMLSGETAAGRYPREAVAMMARIVEEAESGAARPPRRRREGTCGIEETVADVVALAADELRMRVIAVFTQSGHSARLVSKARPSPPIVAFSHREEVVRRLALLWGVSPLKVERIRTEEELVPLAERQLERRGLVKRGDVVALVAGTPLHTRGTTNLIKFHTVGA
jgi:pyruvate kinase